MAITFGSAGAPSQETRNFDALFTTALSNYQRTLADNISTSNAFFAMIVSTEGYQSVDGGTDIKLPLLHTLGQMDWYEGYDTLDTSPMDGITHTIWEWREASIPISISRREERQHAQNLMPLIENKINQAEMGFKEGLAKAILQGSLASGGSSLETPQTSTVTGAQGVHPLGQLIQKVPTSDESVGNINQSTHSFWRNQTKSSSASTYDAFLKEVENIYNSCGKGPGGPPNIILCDQKTYELFTFALWNRGGSRHDNATTLEFPFEHIKWRNAVVTWDEFVPDVQNDTIAITKGTMYFLNTQFFRIKYDSASNFTNTEFRSPPNQPNARVAHILWMGNVCVNNRRKHGVMYNITTTISS